MSDLSDVQWDILSQVAKAGGRVKPDAFNGKGYAVAGLVRRGILDWERGNLPKSLNASGLLLTEFGRR